MTVQGYIVLLISFGLMFGFTSCKTAPKMKLSISRLDSIIKPRKVSINDLARNYKSYHGQYVETTGLFYAAFEQFAIYAGKEIWSNKASGFWLDINNELNIDDAAIDKMNETNITIKGLVDTTRKGI